MCIRRFLPLAPVAAVLVFPAAGQAADPPVFVDPANPAGKEYAIPIEAGRADGAGTENHHAAADTPFGVGVRPPGGGSGGSGGSGHAGGSSGHRHDGGAGATRRHRGDGGAVAARPTGGTGSANDPNLRNRIAQAEEPGGTELWTLGIALAVLVTAGLLAFALRRRGEQLPG